MICNVDGDINNQINVVKEVTPDIHDESVNEWEKKMTEDYTVFKSDLDYVSFN